MAQIRDLTFAFQPLIHEPLSSRSDVNGNSCETDQTNENVTRAYQRGEGCSPQPCNGDSNDLFTSSREEGKKVAMAVIAAAVQCQDAHPRKAMSLFLKAGKALILAGEEDVALQCLESLIHLASDQLRYVQEERIKLAPPTPGESRKVEMQLNREPSVQSGSSDVSETAINGHSPVCSISSSEEQTCIVVAEPCMEQIVAMDKVKQLNNETLTSVDGIAREAKKSRCGSETCTTSQEITATELELSETLWADEDSQTEFEVVMLDSCDDSVSMCSADVVVVHTHEIMVECGEHIVEEVPTSPQQKALVRRSYVVNELIDTEQSYIQDMAFVIKGYVPKLSSENSPLELRHREKEVFGNIQDIFEWHSCEFFKYLRNYEDQPDRIGELFFSSERKLELLYTDYCRNKPKSDGLVQKYADSFFKECKDNLGHRLHLSDYLIKPVQRITKYQLLLKDILKHTARAGEDSTDVQRALDVVLRILKRTNDMVNVAMLQGFEAKPEETGELIFQDSFDVADGKTKSKGKERRVFLFERLLIITEPIMPEGGLPAYKYIHSMKTQGLGQTESVDSDPCKWAVWQRKRGGADIFVLTAKNAQAKETWIENIKVCQQKKKRGFLRGIRYRTRKEGRSLEEDCEDVNSDSGGRPGTRRTTIKKKTMKTTKKGTRESAQENVRRSERLQDSVKRFAEEERQLHREERRNGKQTVEHLLDDGSVPASPGPESADTEFKTKLAASELRAMLDTQETQLHKLLMLTRMIAARLLQARDGGRALTLYNDVIRSMLPIEELKKLEPMHTARDVLLQLTTEFYDNWRRERANTGNELEESYNSLVSLLNETAGFSSQSKGSPWSVILYLVTAAACCREQHWLEASQAFYRMSQVYSALQAPKCAVDSLLDAHYMCCQAEDFLTALQFLYNAFIRVLMSRDVFRCLRLEQQALFLVEKIKSLKDTTPKGNISSREGCEEDRGQQISVKHVEFLVNMSRASRRKDWAWFEISEAELQGMSTIVGGQEAEAVLQVAFVKIKKSLESPLDGDRHLKMSSVFC